MIHFLKTSGHLRVMAVLVSAATADPIVINSVSSNIDDATNTADFTNIVVSQGSTRLTAERARATGVGFQNSQWTFEGGVVITLEPRGTLWADQAVLEFRDGALTQLTAVGSPARFEEQGTDSHLPQYGRADEITYAAKQDTVSFSGHAEMSDGHGMQITAPVFVYHVQDEQLVADSQNAGRIVHLTVKP